jgi:predicted GIY-YIG superfamily endonuclease
MDGVQNRIHALKRALDIQQMMLGHVESMVDCKSPEDLLERLDEIEKTRCMSGYFPPLQEYVYVLLCESDNVYVGYTKNLAKRLGSHFDNEGGSEWTRLYPPVRVMEIQECIGKDMERELTLKYMRTHGYEKVRGAGWTSTYLNGPPAELRALPQSGAPARIEKT